MKPTPLLIRPIPIAKFCIKEALDRKMVMALIDVKRLHAVLDNTYNEVTNRNHAKRKHTQLLHNARTSLQLINSIIGDYIMVRAAKKGLHKVAIGLQEPMRIIETKSKVVFDLESMYGMQQRTANA